MDDEIERLVIAVRADTQGFSRDVASMRGELEGPFADGAARAGRALETTLSRAIRTGKLGFEDLKAVALSVLDTIAASALKSGIGALFGGADGGGGQGGGGGLLSLGGSILGSVLGLPGRATGGPVSPGRAYMVGERGPEIFVPTASGSIATNGGGGRDVRIALTINAPANTAPDMLARSSRQVARAVRNTLANIE